MTLPQHLADKLSPRELDIVELLLQGMANKEIANLLGIAEKTVKMHLTEVYKALKVNGRNRLMFVALSHPLILKKDIEV